MIKRKKCNIFPEGDCSFCAVYEELIEYVLHGCPIVYSLWIKIHMKLINDRYRDLELDEI